MIELSESLNKKKMLEQMFARFFFVAILILIRSLVFFRKMLSFNQMSFDIMQSISYSALQSVM